MIKRTLYFGNPAYLSLTNKQLIVKLPEVEKNEGLSDQFKRESVASIPIEDIGVVILDDKQITITHGLLGALLENNAAILTCDDSHLPAGYLMPLSGNTVQTEKFKEQISASIPLKKNLWQQTVQAKIENQAHLLSRQSVDVENMLYWRDSVKSGDPDNYEGRAAAYYWSNLFSGIESAGDPLTGTFRREREGMPPNNLLNYGYAIIRAIIARSLVGSGLLPTFGIFHRNRYNAYCLADDIMEPYRPFVDEKVRTLISCTSEIFELTKDFKRELLSIATTDVVINGERSPLMIAAQRTTSSLSKCYSGEIRKIVYPSFL